VFSHLGEESKMTDRERDQIDADAEVYIKTCVSAIQQLRTQGTSTAVSHSHVVMQLAYVQQVAGSETCL